MSDSRAKTLDAIRSSLGRGPLPPEVTSTLQGKLDQPRPNIVPERGNLPPAERVELFISEAERVNATVERLRAIKAVPAAVAQYLREAELPLFARVGTDELLAKIRWSKERGINVETGAAEDRDTASVTAAFAGIAETGTLMLVSSPESPTSLNFLPLAHIVVLPVARIVGAYEDAWARLRGARGHGAMPRVVNWVSGPSRTADIEQTLLLGAHGPRRLHILVCDGKEK
ncbi:MAG: LUD domain-containing protein [Rhodospirillales bacterium]|nr:LUD domain-containing protein [Rhodospirillales bacterium]